MPSEPKPSTGKGGKAPGRSNYTDQDKREAVVRYMLLGSYREVSRQLKIHHTTILAWKDQPWWAEVREAIESQRRNSPVSKDMNLRIDNILSFMVGRLETPGVIESLQPRELGFNIRELMRARTMERSERGIEEIGENADPHEVETVFRACLRELKESRQFGESGRKLEDLPSLEKLLHEIESEELMEETDDGGLAP